MSRRPPEESAVPPRALDESAVRRVELFKALEPAACTDIVRNARRRLLLRGGIAFKQGEAPHTVLMVLSGRFKAMQVTSEGGQIVTRLVGPGDLMGHVSVFTETPYPATPTAVVDSVVLAWSPRVFTGLMLRHPALSLAIVRNMGKAIHEAHTRLREASTEHVERRIAHAVLRLARQAGRRVEGGVEIAFPITRQDIGLMSGATLHTVSRILSGWEQDGIINGGRQHLVLRDPQALLLIAGDSQGDQSGA